MMDNDEDAANSLYSHCFGTTAMGHPLSYPENHEHERRYQRQHKLEMAGHKCRKRNQNAE